MRKRVFIAFCILQAAVCTAQVNPNYNAYIEQYSGVAIDQMKRYGIPASITLAQGLLESGAGRSTLATKGNNHFGIKCHDWTGRKIYHDDDARGECFRAYRSARESYEDHSVFLSSKQRYASLFRLSKTDYKGWARGLKAAGYATNPHYADNLIGIIERYQLYRYDVKSYKGVTLGRTFHLNNGIVYVIAKSGDSFASLSKELGISSRRLAKYNERNRRDLLKEGEQIYLKKKRTKADKRYKGMAHVVGNGESMYSISQLYGIRLSSLYKKNHLSPDYSIKMGDRLRIY